LVGRSYCVLFLESSCYFFGKYLLQPRGVSDKLKILLQFYVLGVSRDSPLRRTHSLFWNTRTNDEGVPREGSFHALANAGKITLIAPARVATFGDDGHSVILEDGRVLPAAAVILATGYESTWRSIFDGEWIQNLATKVPTILLIGGSIEQLGLGRHPPERGMALRWDYASLANPPVVPATPWAASIYRGLVPAKNILNRDFAVNGAMVCTLPSRSRGIPQLTN
jgi:dimethylaniline monooxygenase (N-oxide forming)